jgi:archaellum component FlaG (FlaF/FlaG flagellin family)
MRKAFSMVMALLLVAGFAAGFQTPATVAQNAPALVSQITDSSGTAIAEISVDSLANPFEDYDDFSSPQRGFDFVLLTVTITNVGELPYAPQASSFFLVDSDGFMVTPGYLSFEEGVAAPQLTGDPIEPGDSVTGTIPFEVLSGSEIAAIVYQPSFDRYSILAASVDAPELGTAVDIVGEEGGVVGSVTVDEFVDPLQDVDPSYQAQRGYHHAGAVITIENTGDRPLSVDPSTIQIIDADGYALYSSGVYRGEEAETPNLDYVDLAPGDTVTGMVTFELFNDAAPGWLVYTSGSTQLTFLAAFPDAPALPALADIPAFTPGASTTSNSGDDTDNADDSGDEPVVDDSTPVAVSADCAEVGEWITRLEDRFDAVDDTAVDVEDTSEIANLNLDDMLDFLDQLEQVREEQEADTPPALAEDVQTSVIALLDVEIDLVNDVINAMEDGDDVEAVVNGYDTQVEDAFTVYFDAYTALGESCPNIFE